MCVSGASCQKLSWKQAGFSFIKIESITKLINNGKTITKSWTLNSLIQNPQLYLYFQSRSNRY